MTWQGWLFIALLVVLLAAATKPLGGYIARIADTPRSASGLGVLERQIYRLAGIDPTHEQTWAAYALSLLCFHLVGVIALYGIQRLQHLLPLNPQAFDGVAPDLALNTAVSFVTNTSWQSYAGEKTLSHLTQMMGITVQSFLSAATGIAVALALVRGFARASAGTIGNFGSTWYASPSTCCCRSQSSRRRCWPSRGCRKLSRPRFLQRRWKAAANRSPSVRSRRRKPSSS
jgi:K+-transporting ATPase ATPase A chain